jgi:hypothetical protein
MNILEVLARELFWLFDGIGLNLILKKMPKPLIKRREIALT